MLIAFIISSAFLAASIAWGIVQFIRYDRTKIFPPRIILIAGTAVASFVWFLPVYCIQNANRIVPSIVQSFVSTIKIFAADGIKSVTVTDDSSAIFGYHMLLGNILSFVAPALTLTVVFSLFKSVWAYLKYFINFKKQIHVFSELNDRSLAMAKRLRDREGGKKYIIAFADIIDKKEEAHLDLVDGAKKINAILFRNDLEAIGWTATKRNKRNLNFYLISNDIGEKIRHAKNIVQRYNSSNCSLFIFDNSEETKMLLGSYQSNTKETPIKIKISRIDDIRLLTYGYLADKGSDLFKNPPKEDGLEIINVTIVGFGGFGAEMFKALLWYCQMPGYKVNITIIDKDASVQPRFEAAFPGLKIGEDFSESNDIRYHIEFKNSTFGEKQFIDDVKELPMNNFFFVFMGDDETNMLAINAIKCARMQAGKFVKKKGDKDSDIFTTIINNSDIKKLVKESSSINVINEIDPGFLFVKKQGESSFIDDGLSEHKLGNRGNADVIVFGFGDNEQRAIKNVSEYYANETLWVTVYTNKVRDKANETSPSLPQNLNVKYKTLDKKEADQDFYKKINESNPLVICFPNNDVLSPDELTKNKVKFILSTNKVKSVNSYLKKRDEEMDEEFRNGYHLDDYNFYSSLSHALHRKLREKIKGKYSEPYTLILENTHSSINAKFYKHDIMDRHENENPQIKQAAERELHLVAEIEHVRWNAYMLTEGFVFNQTKDRPFKMHNNIVKVEALTYEDYLKDI